MDQDVARKVRDFFGRRLPGMALQFHGPHRNPNQPMVHEVWVDAHFTVPVLFHEGVTLSNEQFEEVVSDAAEDLAMCMFLHTEPALDPFKLIASSQRLADFVAKCVREGVDPMNPP